MKNYSGIITQAEADKKKSRSAFVALSRRLQEALDLTPTEISIMQYEGIQFDFPGAKLIVCAKRFHWTDWTPILGVRPFGSHATTKLITPPDGIITRLLEEIRSSQ